MRRSGASEVISALMVAVADVQRLHLCLGCVDWKESREHGTAGGGAGDGVEPRVAREGVGGGRGGGARRGGHDVGRRACHRVNKNAINARPRGRPAALQQTMTPRQVVSKMIVAILTMSGQTTAPCGHLGSYNFASWPPPFNSLYQRAPLLAAAMPADLFEAVADGDVDGVTSLLAADPPASVESVDEEGNTPLHKAAEGETGCLKAMLVAPGAAAALGMKNAEGLTPLMCAIKYEDAEIVGTLVEPAANGVEGVAAEKTEEAIALARSLELLVVVEKLTGEEAPADKIVKTDETFRRTSVSGDDINDFSKTYSEEKGKADTKEVVRRTSVAAKTTDGAKDGVGGDAMAAALLVPEKDVDEEEAAADAEAVRRKSIDEEQAKANAAKATKASESGTEAPTREAAPPPKPSSACVLL